VPSRKPPSRQPTAIVDIGSNSVRLVVYSGAPRVPAPIFNEKVLAGLGAALADTGELSARSQEKALTALQADRTDEGGLLGYYMEEIRWGARDLGLVDVRLGLEGLLEPLARGAR